MIKYQVDLLIILFLFSITILNGGCGTPGIKKLGNGIGMQDEKLNNTSSVSSSELILGVGDTIDISVYRKKTPEFVLGIGDTIEITVYRNSDLDKSVQIDTYGRIMLPLIGDIQADGRLATELRDEIQQKLSKYLINPQVTINVSPIQDLKVDDLSLSTRIGFTGRIMLPLIGDIQADGRLATELRNEIQQKLSKYLVEPQVIIKVSDVQSKKVHVLGEVKSPGTFTLDQKMLAWEAIAKTGGFTTNANKKNVLLVRSEKGVAKVAALNLNIGDMLKDGKLDQNVYLRSDDIIYVVPSFIANVERFMVRLQNIISPLVTIETGIILEPQAVDVLRGEEDEERQVIVPP